MPGGARCLPRGLPRIGKSDPVRIVYLTDTFSLLSQTFVYDRALALRQRGHDVRVVTLKRRMEQERPFDKVEVLRRAVAPGKGAALAVRRERSIGHSLDEKFLRAEPQEFSIDPHTGR